MCEGIKPRKRRGTKGYHQGDCQCLVKLALFLGPTHLRKKVWYPLFVHAINFPEILGKSRYIHATMKSNFRYR